MKFAQALYFATCFIASLQALSDKDTIEVANDYFTDCFHVRVGGHCSGTDRYTFNANTHRCEEFGGCGGNKNNFESKAACEATCFRNQDEVPVIPAE